MPVKTNVRDMYIYTRRVLSHKGTCKQGRGAQSQVVTCDDACARERASGLRKGVRWNDLGNANGSESFGCGYGLRRE